MSGKKKVEELDLNQWIDLLERYKQTPGYRPGAAMRIEDTPFTTARYFGGMELEGERYTYFEPEIPGEKPNADGSPYVAWLMVREDFLKWVTAEVKKGAVP